MPGNEDNIIMGGTIRRRLAAFATVALAVVGGLTIASQSEASGPKSYTASAAPAKLVSGTQTVAITLTNTSRNNIAFAAANLAVPAGLPVSGALTLQPPVGTAMLSADGATIQLRDLNTPKNSAVTVRFSVTATIQDACSSYTFVSDVRQSNDFNGTNNKFALEASDATFSGPCSSATITCTAGDGAICTTGLIESAGGDTATVVLNDGDGISGTLTAAITADALTCPGYTPTSDRLDFGITTTVGNLAGLTKSVTFTQPQPAGDTREAWQYQACFQAPETFPALDLTQLEHDFATSDFSGNTVYDPATGTYTGLLLPCAAGYGVPCLANRSIDNGVVSITLTVKAGDPGLRF